MLEEVWGVSEEVVGSLSELRASVMLACKVSLCV